MTKTITSFRAVGPTGRVMWNVSDENGRTVSNGVEDTKRLAKRQAKRYAKQFKEAGTRGPYGCE